MNPRLWIVPVAALLLLLTACGGSSDGGGSDGGGDTASAEPSPDAGARSGAPLELDGLTFLSSDVTGHDLVADTQVRLAFEDGTMAATAGCNTIFGAYAQEQGVLAWADAPASTRKACEPDLSQQDAWLTDLLTPGVRISGDATSLTLTADDTTLTMAVAQEPAVQPLVGTSWTLTATFEGGTTSALPPGVTPPTMNVADDGSVQLFTGCNRGRTTVATQGSTATFEPPATTKMACPEPASTVEAAVLAVLDGPVDYVVDASGLVLTKDGRGLVFEAS